MCTVMDCTVILLVRSHGTMTLYVKDDPPPACSSTFTSKPYHAPQGNGLYAQVFRQLCETVVLLPRT